MRAWHRWLAVGPLLVFVGCTTLHDRAAPAVSPSALTSKDERKAGALAHYSLALISEATLGGSEAALSHLRSASAADPSNLPLAIKVASGHLTRKEYDAAKTVLARTLTHHPESMEAHLLLGIAMQLTGENRLAEREYQTAVRSEPAASEPKVRLASLYVAEEQPRKALAIVDKALMDPGLKAAFVEFCDNMGRLYLLSEQPEWAVAFFERAAKAAPDRLVLKARLARAQAEAGNRRAAIAGLLELAGRFPNDAQVALLLGELYEDEGDDESAARQYARAIKVKPGDTGAVLRLAGTRLKGHPDEALKLMEDAAVRHPEDLAVLTYLGLLYNRLERFDDAIGQFSKVEAMVKQAGGGPKSLQPHFYFWYGSACERAGRYEEGERLLRQCLELAPDSAQALNYLAYMWADRGINLDKSLEYVTRALDLVPDEGAYLDTLGWVYYRKGEHGKALNYLKKAVKALPDDPVVYEHLGDVFHELGRDAKARRYWEKGLTLEPGKLAPSSPGGK